MSRTDAQTRYLHECCCTLSLWVCYVSHKFCAAVFECRYDHNYDHNMHCSLYLRLYDYAAFALSSLRAFLNFSMILYIVHSVWTHFRVIMLQYYFACVSVSYQWSAPWFWCMLLQKWRQIEYVHATILHSIGFVWSCILIYINVLLYNFSQVVVCEHLWVKCAGWVSDKNHEAEGKPDQQPSSQPTMNVSGTVFHFLQCDVGGLWNVWAIMSITNHETGGCPDSQLASRDCAYRILISLKSLSQRTYQWCLWARLCQLSRCGMFLCRNTYHSLIMQLPFGNWSSHYGGQFHSCQ